jgi:hypothetical protein
MFLSHLTGSLGIDLDEDHVAESLCEAVNPR